MLVVLLVCLSLLWLLYKKYSAVYGIWKERGIQYEPGTFPFGSRSELPLFTVYPGYVYDQMYKKYSNVPYFGFYNFRSPFLVLRDPDMIKNVLAKDFSHFRDRKGFDLPKGDSISNHLFNLEGERWRALRVKLSPTFTTGKLKGMYQHFIDCAEVLDKYLLSKSESVVDVKDITGRFNTDIICSCAFGMEVNTIRDSDNPLRQLGVSVAEMSFKAKLVSSLQKGFPSIASFIQSRVSDIKKELLKNVSGGHHNPRLRIHIWSNITPQHFGYTLIHRMLGDYLMNVIKQSVEHREKNNIKRNDFLDLLIQLQKSKGTLIDDTAETIDEKKPQPVEMTISLMTAQAFVFFFAGFETSSSVQSFCLYELALHPEMQDKLRKEIDSTISKHKALTYQAILEMEYLDMVVSETMRKYPTLSHLTRRCTKTYTTPAGHKIEKGDNILIPTWSLHHDPAHFPEPEKFDPERFSPKNKENIKPYTYLPFGEGPRICIGMRFGQLQTKMGLITLLRKFKVEPSVETPIPVRHGAHSTLSPTEKPIFLKITKVAPAF